MDRMAVIYKHEGQLFTSDYNAVKKDLKLGLLMEVRRVTRLKK